MNRSPTQQLKVDKYLLATPVSSRGILSKAFAEEGSPRQAIKAKCLDCCSFDRSEITHCTVVTCPLHPWRPFQEQE